VPARRVEFKRRAHPFERTPALAIKLWQSATPRR